MTAYTVVVPTVGRPGLRTLLDALVAATPRHPPEAVLVVDDRPRPVRPAGFRASMRAQADNADDVLMRRAHGRDWRVRAGAEHGRFRRHALTTGSGLLALAALAARAVWTAVAAGARGILVPGERTRVEEIVRACEVVPDLGSAVDLVLGEEGGR
ncbi:hypothetical protein GCM10010191_95160 [Actinomadura vinacea]|uniref:Glycosyltransferase n=1 Tax=Actinomadura vinacea TaxID=115336 RepID=A0ABN3KHU4_9ACTN